MQRLEPLIVDTGHNPWQVWALVACVAAGVGGLLPGDRVQSSVDDLLPGWATTAWYVGLLLGGTTCLAALRLKLPRNLLVERAGMVLLGGLLTGYTAAVGLLSGGSVPLTIFNLAAAAVASWWRVWRITGRDLPRLRAGLAAVIAAGGGA